MGKKRVSALGTENESDARAKKAVKLEQKKLREGKTVKPVAAPAINTPAQEVSPTVAETAPASTSKTRVHHRSKAYHAAKSLVDSDKTYPLKDALPLLRKVTVAKFDASVELHITLRDKGFSREIELPYASGKTRRIAIATDETITEIESGKTNFDILLASPAQMPKLVRLAKVLGPKGLMPNPKNGTVVANPEATAKAMAGKNSLLLKTEKDAPIIHLLIGKLSRPDTELQANIESVTSVLPSGIRKIVLKSTISPAIKIQA